MVEIVYMGDIRLGVLDDGAQFFSRLNGVEYPASRFNRSRGIRPGVKIN
jgi:hypothetical protein